MRPSTRRVSLWSSSALFMDWTRISWVSRPEASRSVEVRRHATPHHFSSSDARSLFAADDIARDAESLSQPETVCARGDAAGTAGRARRGRSRPLDVSAAGRGRRSRIGAVVSRAVAGRRAGWPSAGAAEVRRARRSQRRNGVNARTRASPARPGRAIVPGDGREIDVGLRGNELGHTSADGWHGDGPNLSAGRCM